MWKYAGKVRAPEFLPGLKCLNTLRTLSMRKLPGSQAFCAGESTGERLRRNFLQPTFPFRVSYKCGQTAAMLPLGLTLLLSGG